MCGKGIQIPKTCCSNTTWAQHIENDMTKDPLTGYINIGWEEKGNQLLLRFIEKTVDLKYVNNDSWKEINSETNALGLSH